MKYLTIDIGASSGRHIIGQLVNGKIETNEVYRFENKLVTKDNQLCWDLDNLFKHVVEGLKTCKSMDLVPDSIGIDTWGVDFVLLDKEDNIIGNTVAYRDDRTIGMDEVVNKIIPQSELYAKTGIKKQIFNTIYQLVAIKESNKESLDKADSFLMIPDYLNYLLTGVKVNEYTNATTTQLVNVDTYEWDKELIDKLGINYDMFNEIRHAGDELGSLSNKIKEEVGFDAKVILPPTHDTASAVMAVPSINDEFMYISSGTWSLMGVENKQAITSEESMKLNFTNSGGYKKDFLYLKNIRGLWMIQEVRREIENKYSFAELCGFASEEEIDSIVDCSDDVFLAPSSMINAVKEYCKNTNQSVPNKVEEVSAVIYNSLAVSYNDTLKKFEELSGKKFTSINIVGGGSQAEYLNQRTADVCGRVVISGPTEGTAIGNLVCQMISSGEIRDLKEARSIIKDSFKIKEYKPKGE